MTRRVASASTFTPIPVVDPSEQNASANGTNDQVPSVTGIASPNVMPGSLLAQSNAAGAIGPGVHMRSGPASLPASIGIIPASVPESTQSSHSGGSLQAIARTETSA